jgi:hypothetical protein
MSSIVHIVGPVRKLTRTTDQASGRPVVRLGVPINDIWHNCSIWNGNFHSITDAIELGSVISIIGTPSAGLYGTGDKKQAALFVAVSTIAFVSGTARHVECILYHF